MRSAILVEAELTFEIKGEHIHISNEDGSVHLALTRNTFFKNLAKGNAVAKEIGEPRPVRDLGWGTH